MLFSLRFSHVKPAQKHYHTNRLTLYDGILGLLLLDPYGDFLLQKDDLSVSLLKLTNVVCHNVCLALNFSDKFLSFFIALIDMVLELVVRFDHVGHCFPLHLLAVVLQSEPFGLLLHCRYDPFGGAKFRKEIRRFK